GAAGAAAILLLLSLGGLLVWWLVYGQADGKKPDGKQPGPAAGPAAVQPAPQVGKQPARGELPDLQRIQGKWRFAVARPNGQNNQPQAMKDMWVVIDGDQWRWTGPQGAFTTKMILRPNKNPKEIDITMPDGK